MAPRLKTLSQHTLQRFFQGVCNNKTPPETIIKYSCGATGERPGLNTDTLELYKAAPAWITCQHKSCLVGQNSG
ncbi:hypothetical protein NQZ68_023117 [Dissostichus eleginoides]|nr:hypothetical protein NQZ68_023117 [Dissostichus eleginoides]